MDAGTFYAFLLVEISEIFSETTLGMKKLLSRNISYIYGNPKYPPLFEGQSFNIEPYGENERKNSQKLEI